MIKTDSTITIYDAAGTSVNHFEAIKVLKVATGFGFSEGPVWHPDNFLLFSDIPGNRIWQLYPSGEKKIYLENSGFTGNDTSALSDQVGSNGLAIYNLTYPRWYSPCIKIQHEHRIPDSALGQWY